MNNGDSGSSGQMRLDCTYAMPSRPRLSRARSCTTYTSDDGDGDNETWLMPFAFDECGGVAASDVEARASDNRPGGGGGAGIDDGGGDLVTFALSPTGVQLDAATAGTAGTMGAGAAR